MIKPRPISIINIINIINIIKNIQLFSIYPVIVSDILLFYILIFIVIGSYYIMSWTVEQILVVCHGFQQQHGVGSFLWMFLWFDSLEGVAYSQIPIQQNISYISDIYIYIHLSFCPTQITNKPNTLKIRQMIPTLNPLTQAQIYHPVPPQVMYPQHYTQNKQTQIYKIYNTFTSPTNPFAKPTIPAAQLTLQIFAQASSAL